MPKFAWSQGVAIGGTFSPLTTWQYQYVPFGGVIQVLHRATGTGLVTTITFGSDTVQERSPVSAGGTAGLMPSVFDVPPLQDEVAMGDLVKIFYDNTSGAVVTVDGEIDYTPVG